MIALWVFSATSQFVQVNIIHQSNLCRKTLCTSPFMQENIMHQYNMCRKPLCTSPICVGKHYAPVQFMQENIMHPSICARKHYEPVNVYYRNTLLTRTLRGSQSHHRLKLLEFHLSHQYLSKPNSLQHPCISIRP